MRLSNRRASNVWLEQLQSNKTHCEISCIHVAKLLTHSRKIKKYENKLVLFFKENMCNIGPKYVVSERKESTGKKHQNSKFKEENSSRFYSWRLQWAVVEKKIVL